MKKTTLFSSMTLISAAILLPSLWEGQGMGLFARENTGQQKGKNPPSLLAGCAAATAQTDLAVNNVRARLLTGGDMWWNLSDAAYEIPKGGGIHSIFAGSLWIGGIDQGKQLRVAGQTYRQHGNDFWPGPLDTTNASITKEECAAWDKFFRITRKEVETFVSTGTTTPAILNWPGNGDLGKNQAQYMAPFFDKDGDGTYNPSAGDYPGFDLVQGDGYGDCQAVNCIPVDQLFGDESIWWVINDIGNIHTETGGPNIGLEIRHQAFGFATDDDINNMTFYNYRIFNRSTYQLDSCYMGVWCDADLGNYTDDYVGCDVKRGLGYTYNSDDYDEPTATPPGYGSNPPAVGIDFFQGPLADAGDGKDNDRDCGTDETCEQIIMSGFLYYDNTNSVPWGNPVGDVWFYNYLHMKWADGVPVTYGGTGYQSGGPVCNFMYPGCPADGTSIPPSNTTDEHDWGIGGNCSTTPTLAAWSEGCSNNTAQDRRMLLSAGPFTLLPGAVNVITTGVVWARANAGGALASVTLLQGVDDVAQALFDNCFKVLDGPTAPDITVQELDNELLLYLSNNDPGSNNFNETYTEFDPTIIAPSDSNGNFCTIDKYYHFEGYKIFQLKTSTVSANDLEDADKARLVFQCDIKNNVSRLINYEWDANLAAAVPMEKVNGADAGIAHSIKVTTDAFATGASNLINHKPYYFMAVAYGYNEYKKYAQDIPPVIGICSEVLSTPATDGQKKPYKQGRKNLKVYSAIPHAPAPEMGGTTAQSSYGSTIAITRIEGNGNGGMNLAFNSSTVSDILAAADYRAKTITYLPGYGPVNVKVVDPLNVPVASFTLRFDSVASITYTQRIGTFIAGDTIKGATSGATAKVLNDNGSIMHIDSIVGDFADGEYIQKFGNSGISAKSIVYNPGKSPYSNSSKHLIDYSTWALINNTTGDTIYSDKTIRAGNEHLIPQLGLSISFEQVADPGSNSTTDNNGFIGAGMAFSDNSKNWLTGLADIDGCFNENWIRCGTVIDTDPCVLDYTVDNNQIYEAVLGGTWAPYRVCAFSDNAILGTPPTIINPSLYHAGPAIPQAINNAKLSDLASVDLVITSDKSKWSRTVVVELCEDSSYSSNSTGGLVSARARKFDFRRALSIDKNGSPATGSDNNDFATGMGWFPGYAINLETGERLNIAFGENSALTTRSNEWVISYNRRDTIVFNYLKDGPFSPGEQIIAYTSNASATIVSPVGGNTIIIESISGIISPDDIIVGQTSDAKAVVTSITGNKFQNGETVMGASSGASGDITVNNNNTSVMVINNISGTFVAGEQISGMDSWAIAKVVAYSPYKFEQNGADMLWNPTATKTDSVPWNQASTPNSVYGGQHYIYIFGHNKDSSQNDGITIPRYDKGKKLRQILHGPNGNGLPPNTPDKMKAFSHAIWVNIPLLVSGHSLLESEVLISLRVRKSYKPGYSPAWYKQGTLTIYSDVEATPQNSNLPMYTFNTSGIETLLSQTEVAKSALDMIRVVPNPYYAFSLYETSKLDSRVKITNVPETSTVSIYNLGGTLIRKYTKGEPGTNHTPKGGTNDAPSWHDGSVEWDLKNTAGVPISSGVYIIHVEVPGVGEKVIKWFGIMRPIDLDSF